MHKIIVTGATSMIGVALINEAIEQQVEVYAIVRPHSSRLKRLPNCPYIHLVESDISNVSSIMDLPKADVFYHLAWVGTGKVERDNPYVQEKNIKYALDAVKLAQRCHCKRFIGAGSQAEYGIVTDTITESTMESPLSSYGMAKLSANMLCRKCCEQTGMDYIWGRIFSVYGINDNTGTMLDYAIEQFMMGKEALFSAATQMWNYLYEADAGKIFFLLGEADSAHGIYNIANKESKPLCDYIKVMADVVKEKFDFDIRYSFGKELVKNVVTLKPDISRLMDTVGDIEMTGFKEGVEKIILSKCFDNFVK